MKVVDCIIYLYKGLSMVLGIRGRAGTGRSRAHICAYSKSTIGASVDPLQPRSQPASPTGITNWPNTPRQFLTPPASFLPPAYALSYPRRSARVRARAHCHYPRPELPSTLCHTHAHAHAHCHCPQLPSTLDHCSTGALSS